MKKTTIIIAIVFTMVLFIALDIAGVIALANGENMISSVYWLSAIGYAVGGCKLIHGMEA